MDASLNYVYMQVEGVGLPNVNDTAEAYVGNFSTMRGESSKFCQSSLRMGPL